MAMTVLTLIGYKQRIIFENDKIRASFKRRGFGTTRKQTSETRIKNITSCMPQFMEDTPLDVSVNNNLLCLIPDHSSTDAFESMSILLDFPHSSPQNYDFTSSSVLEYSNSDIDLYFYENYDIDATRYSIGIQLPSIHLSWTEKYFLDLYQNKFALSFPFFCDQQNPFLQVLFPIALENPQVRCALMLLAGSNELSLVNDELKDEYAKQKKTLFFIVKSYLCDPVSSGSQTSLSNDAIILFLLTSILIFEKLNGYNKNNTQMHLRALLTIFQRVEVSYILGNKLAWLAFKIFLCNDIMYSLSHFTEPFILCLNNYEILISNFSFVQLILEIIRHKLHRDVPRNSATFTGIGHKLSQKIDDIDDWKVVEWLPSLPLNDSKKTLNWDFFLAKIYKLHLRFYCAEDEDSKRMLATQIAQYILKLPTSCNVHIAILPHVKSIIGYLKGSPFSEEYLRRIQKLSEVSRYKVFESPQFLTDSFNFS